MSESSALRICLQTLEQGIAIVCEAVIGITLCGMLAVMLCSIVLRSLSMGLRFTTWASELPELLFPWLIAAGLVLAVQRGAHLSILFLTVRLRGGAFSLALLVRLVAIVAVYGVLSVESAQVLPIVAEEHSAILGVSQGLTWACLLAGFVLLIASELIISARYFLWGVRPVSSLSAEAA